MMADICCAPEGLLLLYVPLAAPEVRGVPGVAGMRAQASVGRAKLYQNSKGLHSVNAQCHAGEIGLPAPGMLAPVPTPCLYQDMHSIAQKRTVWHAC